jgi:hypothetical protein
MKADITSLLQLDGEGRQLGQATDALPAADPDVAALAPRVLHQPVFGAVPRRAVPDGGDGVVEDRVAVPVEHAAVV